MLHHRFHPIHFIHTLINIKRNHPLWDGFYYYMTIKLFTGFDCSLSSSKACDRHTEWRARYIVQTYLVAELH